MPEKPTNNIEIRRTLPSEDVSNPIELREMFVDEIVDRLKTSDLATKLDVINLIFTQSIRDGIDISNKLGITSKEQIKALVSSSRGTKQDTSIISSIFTEIERNKNYINQDNLEFVSEEILRFQDRHKKTETSLAMQAGLNINKEIRDTIVSYYEPFLAKIRLGHQDSVDNLSQPERLLLNLLRNREYRRDPKIPLRPIIGLIEEKGLEIPNNIKSLDDLSISELEKLLGEYGITLEDAKMRGAIKPKIQYLEIEAIKKSIVLETLKVDLKEKLKQRGLKYNQFAITITTDGRYEVIDLRKNKDNLRIDEEKKEVEIKNFESKKFHIENGRSIGQSMSMAGKLAFVMEEKERYKVIYDGKPVTEEWYIDISYLTDINGKPAFIAREKEGYRVIYDGKPVTKEWYDWINQIIDVNGKLAFVARGEEGYRVIYDGKSVMERLSDVLGTITNIDGKLAFIAREKEGYRVIYDGKPVTKEWYDWINQIIDVNGKLAYIAREKEGFRVIYDGKPVTEEWYVNISYLTDINGKPAFIAREKEGYRVIYDGKPVTEEWYVDISHLINVNGKLAFMAKGEEGFRVIYDGKPVTEEWYVNISRLTNINGKLAFAAREKEGYRVIYDGKPVTEEWYKDISHLINVNGKLAFIVTRENGRQVIYDGKPVTDQDGWIDQLNVINDKLAFVLYKKEGRQVIYDGKPVTEDLSGSISHITNINGKLAFIVNRKGEGQVIYDGKPLGEKYDKIYFISYEDNIFSICANQGRDLIYLTLNTNNYDQKQIVLNESEQKILDTLNIIKNGDTESELKLIEELDSLSRGNHPGIIGSKREEIQKTIPKNRGITNIFSKMIRKIPSMFFDQLRSKPTSKHSEIERIVNEWFPEIAIKRAEEKRDRDKIDNESLSNKIIGKGGDGSGGSGSKKNILTHTPESLLDFLTQKDSFELSGTGLNRDENREGVSNLILRFTEPQDGIVLTQIAMRCDDNTGIWHNAEIPLSKELQGITDIVTAEIPQVQSGEKIILPKFTDGNICPKIIGVGNNDENISIDSTIDLSGITKIIVPKGVRSISYSQERQLIPYTPYEISETEYQKFKHKFEKRYGLENTKKISDLPVEIKIFIDSINNLEPLQKLIEIEKFVREISYYDFDNKETILKKRGKGNNERIDIMDRRMQELKQRKFSSDLRYKKYAGVCADFALLTTAILKESGFVSGIINGMRVKGTNVTQNNTHALSFVLWPERDGSYRIVEIDGTADGLSEEENRLIENVRIPLLSERIEKARKEQEEIIKKSQQRFNEIQKILEEGDLDVIASLSEEELTSLLNVVLTYSVKVRHYKIIEGILDAHRYGPYKSDNIDDRSNLLLFLESETSRLKIKESVSGKNNTELNKNYGVEFFEMIKSFVKRYTNDKPEYGQLGAINEIENIILIVNNKLEDEEKKVFFIVINYLKAKYTKKLLE